MCGINSYNKIVRRAVFSLDTGPNRFATGTRFIALSIIRCSKSAQKFAAWVCQVATIVKRLTLR